jgi:hypothetical protein
VVLRQRKESTSRESCRHRDAPFTVCIVLQQFDAFKEQPLAESRRISLYLQTVAILPAGAQIGDRPLAANFPV